MKHVPATSSRWLLPVLLLAASLGTAQAQTGGVRVGTAGTPDASAVLDVSSTTKGLLAPRLTAAQRAAIASPAAGLLVYQTDGVQRGVWYYEATAGWTYLNPAPSGDNLGNHTATTNLGLNGNWLSNAPGNANGLRVDGSGNVGIGTATPGQALDVNGSAAIGGNAYVSGGLGVVLNQQDRPLITRGWDAFASGAYQGAGRWGLFMESEALTFGVPALANKRFQWVRYNDNSAINGTLMTLTQDGSLGIGASIPSQKLEVAGQVFSSTGGFRFPDGTVQTTAASTSTNANAVLNQGTVQNGASFNIDGNGTVGGRITAGAATVNNGVTVGTDVTMGGRMQAGSSLVLGTSSVDGTALFSTYVAIGGVLPSGGYPLTVNGDIDAKGVRLSRGAAPGRVLTTNGSGVASWVAPALSVSNGMLTIAGGNTVPVSDNLGNHTATQNINMAGYLLTSYGGGTGLSVTSGGSVGIGTATPTNTLEVRSSGFPTMLVGNTAGQAGALYFGNTGHGLARSYNAANDVGLFTTSGNIYLSANGSGIRTQFALLNNGYVGIGTETPAAPLHVKGASAPLPVQSGSASFFSAGQGLSAVNNMSGNKTVAAYFEGGEVWVDGYIVAGNLTTTSDRRIKHVVGLSDRAADLALLNRLRITDYTYIDQINNTNQLTKKVIAQEVEEVLPAAVSRSTKPIPNVYERATKVSYANGQLTVTTAKPHELPAASGRMRFYTPTNEALDPNVTVLDAHTVRFASAEAQTAGLFVYGKYVDDFRSVDYDALAMLNVSATQELARKVAALEKQNAALQARAATTEAAAAADKAQTTATLESLAERLRALEAGGGQARK